MCSITNSDYEFCWYDITFTYKLICHVNLIYDHPLQLYLKFPAQIRSFLVCTFSTLIVMHFMQTKPASKVFSSHVMDNAHKNYSQDSPTPPLQMFRIILLIYFKSMPIAEHGRTVIRGNKAWASLREWKHFYYADHIVELIWLITMTYINYTSEI